MLEPGPAVTPRPLPDAPHRLRPSKGLVPSRPPQGSPPPRSVSSMRTLLPLKLAPPSPKPAQRPGRMPSLKMDVNESDAPAFNLAELLVQDLEDSKLVFRSRSMTSGCPIQGLEGAVDVDEDDGSSFHGPDIPRYSSPRYRRRSMSGHRSNSALPTGGVEQLGPARYQDAHVKYGGDCCSDSASGSSMVIEPLSIRTRQQSVTTTATSVSGRCSSFTSTRFVSPGSTSPSASFSHKPQHRQGTWFDADDDSVPSSEGRTNSLTKQPYYLHHRSSIDLKNDNFRKHMSSTSPKAAVRPTVSTNFHFPLRNPADTDGQRVPTGPPLAEKPRIVNIQPSVMVPKRKSSLKRSHGRLARSATAYAREHGDETLASREYDQEEIHPGENGTLLNSSPSVAMMTTSCGRTIIDASRPSSLDLATEALQRRAQVTHQRRLSVIENDDLDDGEEAGEYTYPERPTRFRDLSQGNVYNWLDSGIQNLPPGAAEFPSGACTPGIPLPPEVIDTLRISLSCFPETMLLSSSLSIETIRAYSRKLRHQVGAVSGGGSTNSFPYHHQSHADDARSVFSFTSHGTKRTSKRWRFRRFVSSKKRDRHHYSHNNNSSQKDSFTSSAELHMPSPEVHQAPPMTANWAPIKRVFPTGSDYLCDALYAHIIAYNYLNTLSPAPLNNPTPASPNQRATEPNSPGGGRKVPKKAASILGMQNQNQNHSNHNPAAVAGQGPVYPLNQVASRRLFSVPAPSHDDRGSIFSGGAAGQGHGSGGIEAAVIRDLQAGLTRCIGLLVNTLERTMTNPNLGGGATATEERLRRMRSRSRSRSQSRSRSRSMLEGDGGGWDGEVISSANHVVDEVLMRALCEVVRVSEEAAVW